MTQADNELLQKGDDNAVEVESMPNDEEIVSVVRPRRQHSKPEGRGKFFVLRQILNVLFMIIAVIGCIFYIKVDALMGAIVIVIAMAFKMAECVLRYMK